ncbi:MAG: glycosyl hydrolase [Bacteroidota bacterium]
MKTILLLILLHLPWATTVAQLKFVLEDFEGLAYGPYDLKPNGVFVYGYARAAIEKTSGSPGAYAGDRYIRVERAGLKEFGGWGKGAGLHIELDAGTDHLNFYFFSNDTATLKIELQEDDDGNSVFSKNNDDLWIHVHKPAFKNSWQLVSIPLHQFKDDNYGGDGLFNVSYKKGKLFSLVIGLAGKSSALQYWCFDFICFSKNKLPLGKDLFSAPAAQPGDFCSLGAWSKEGNTANFADIAYGFEKHYGFEKKLGVVHFFQPFAFDGGLTQNLYPSVERINKVIDQGYIPMITLEDHFVNISPLAKQPNLYSIVEKHLDAFFIDWAKQIKQVKGTVLLRILHEFNGDWYPWCIAQNDKNPQLLVNAFRHIRNIFYAQHTENVKFIWCPNSMSVPQESWNFIMDAYPGNEWVDFVGLDIYNGAGNGFQPWRSFRKEGIENYFMLTQYMPDKPLLICEVASRERLPSEAKGGQDKAGWIMQMSEALKTDMSKVRLLTWFNEKKTYHIDSSVPALQAFVSSVVKDGYFKSGTSTIYAMLGK